MSSNEEVPVVLLRVFLCISTLPDRVVETWKRHVVLD